jgi:hypothetical protein
MAKDSSPIEVSDSDYALVEEIRLSEELTKKEVVHQAIIQFYFQWTCGVQGDLNV